MKSTEYELMHLFSLCQNSSIDDDFRQSPLNVFPGGALLYPFVYSRIPDLKILDFVMTVDQ